MDKKEIRQFFLKKRVEMQNKKELDQILLANILDIAKDYQVISIFHSTENEINTHQIIEGLLKMGKTVAAPRIKNKVMRFYEVKSLNDFNLGFFDIYEPQSEIEVKDFDLIITPLLAFNDELYRVGYGGGYYDRFLKDNPAYKLGIAYSFQYLNQSFQKEYDIALDNVLTERGLFK